LRPSYWHQLAGYQILSEIGGVEGKSSKTGFFSIIPNPEIHRAGVYFARHGILKVWELEPVSPQFTERFKMYARKVMEI
jgi:hypothetical protein